MTAVISRLVWLNSYRNMRTKKRERLYHSSWIHGNVAKENAAIWAKQENVVSSLKEGKNTRNLKSISPKFSCSLPHSDLVIRVCRATKYHFTYLPSTMHLEPDFKWRREGSRFLTFLERDNKKRMDYFFNLPLLPYNTLGKTIFYTCIISNVVQPCQKKKRCHWLFDYVNLFDYVT